jgi:phosphoribosylanthranilate isomerase
MIIQIYAFTDPETASEAARMGVNQVGFVAGKYGLVPGELTFIEAHRIVAALPPGASPVALTMSTDLQEILRMVDAVRPEIVHISTDPDQVGLKDMEILRKRLPAGVKIMKAIPVEGEQSIALAVAFAAFSDYLLLDTKVHGMPGVGATGKIHDWEISRKIVRSVSIPVILAGGLTPENVAAAIETVHPYGVDSNTATNLLGDPVQKDLRLIEAFVKAARYSSLDFSTSHS